MEHKRLLSEDRNVILSLGIYQSENASECHAILAISNPGLSVAGQFDSLNAALGQLFASPRMSNYILVWKRFFVSDAANQESLAGRTGNEAVSFIQQPPLNMSKASLWVYAVENISASALRNGVALMERPSYSHVFHTGLHSHAGEDSYLQTESIFRNYIGSLDSLDMTLEANCVRTWIFVRDIDNRYKGMVSARNKIFGEEGLIPATHFIASTGIEGCTADHKTLVAMDAYAIGKLQKDQITYLKGLSHLSPTHEYGVSFERGVAVQYGDRRHVLISGTASIDNKGEIVHPGDVDKQLERTLENIGVLLAEGECSFDDVAHLIVYLRDMADYNPVKIYLENTHPSVPAIILLAPVCRPGWLVEIECMAIKECNDSRFPDF